LNLLEHTASDNGSVVSVSSAFAATMTCNAPLNFFRESVPTFVASTHNSYLVAGLEITVGKLVFYLVAISDWLLDIK
jgi:hypothetical protein